MINRIGTENTAAGYRPPQAPAADSGAPGQADTVTRSSTETLDLIPRPQGRTPHGGMMPPAPPSAPPAPPAPPQELPTERYKGNFNGKAFNVDKPTGWTVANTPVGVVFVDPADPKTSASFSWFNGMGPMSPQNLVNGIVSQMGISNLKVLDQKGSDVNNPMAGQVPLMYEEVTFNDREGKAMHAVAVSQVGLIPGVYMPSWFGSLSVAAAPEEKWAQVGGNLKKLLESFSLTA